VYVASLIDGVPRTMNVPAYLGIVRDFAQLRRARDVVQKALDAIHRPDASATRIIETIEQDAHTLRAGTVDSEWASGADLVGIVTPIVERAFRERGQLVGQSTGFRELDEITLGMRPGDVWILAARTSMGKSALAQQIALHVAREAPVAMFSLEMSKATLAWRAAVQEAHVNGWRLMTGYAPSADQARVRGALEDLAERKIYVDDGPRRSPAQFRSRLRRLCSLVGPVGLVVIDYLQLADALPEDRRENKTNQVAGVSKAIHQLAQELQVPFLVLAQLNRRVDQSSDKVPQLSDLRDSGAIEQDADVVLLMTRSDYYDKEARDAGTAEVHVAKQRNGKTGVVKLVWGTAAPRCGTRDSWPGTRRRTPQREDRLLPADQ
jgi:replicative DNA helicase